MIDTDYQQDALCPACGAKDENALELFPRSAGDGDETEQTCDCGCTYIVEVHFDVRFTTRVKKP